MAAKIPTFNDRAKASAEAKQAILAKFRTAPKADDPELQKRLAERKAIAEAREARTAERKAAKEAEEARIRAEKLAAEAAEAQRLKEEAARRRQLEIEQKAARDARYAARKARR
jgi:hypothetical protein